MSSLLRWFLRFGGLQLDQVNSKESELGQGVEDPESEAAQDERNNLDFLIFEFKTSLSDRRLFKQNELQPEREDAKEQEIRAQLQFIERNLPGSWPRTGYDDDEPSSSNICDNEIHERYPKAYSFAKDVVERGNWDFHTPIIPTTVQAVENFTKFNYLVEPNDIFERVEDNSSPPGQQNAHVELRKYGASIYDLLATRPGSCPSLTHHALLRTTADRQSSNLGQRSSFELFLSTCPGQDTTEGRPEWHEARCSVTCSTNSHSDGEDSNPQMDICGQIRIYQGHQRRLPLLFNQNRLHIDQRVEAESDSSPLTSLIATLEEKDFITADLKLAKAQLALSLATHILQFYPGPWLPGRWTGEDIYLHSTPGRSKVEIFSLPFVRCALQTSWRENVVVKHSQNKLATCPPFFLSFAQLLVDLHKGKPHNSTHRAAQAWQDALYSEINTSLRDPISTSYRAAVVGCLTHSLDLAQVPAEDMSRRAWSVIREKIVRPLDMNRNMWKRESDQQRKAMSAAKDFSSKEQLAIGRFQAHNPCEQRAKDYQRSATLRVPTSKRHARKKPSEYDIPAVFELFDDDPHTCQKRGDDGRDPATEKFDGLMRNFIYFLDCLDEPNPPRKPIRIAVLDTGICLDEKDELLKGGRERIVKTRSFISDENEHHDSYGHGTHVVRILLRFAPFAEIVVAKVSEDKKFATTQMSQIVQALKWAGGTEGSGCNADIITMCFGIGHTGIQEIRNIIDDFVGMGKLIFAAASNGGGNGTRAYPASNPGVFAIHATDGDGNRGRMNPPKEFGDNFSTLGVAIDSKWKGGNWTISGTSFAAPVAAAIAANALEFARGALLDKHDNPDYFHSYQGMRALFLSLKSDVDGYDYIKPWQPGYWVIGDDEEVTEAQFDMICNNLRSIAKYGHQKRHNIS